MISVERNQPIVFIITVIDQQPYIYYNNGDRQRTYFPEELRLNGYGGGVD